MNAVTSAVQDVGSSLIEGSVLVIAAAFGVCALYLGGRSLWEFFKGLAK